jgi:hypothetical protein
MRSLLGVAVLVVAVAPAADGARSSTWWSLAHARRYLVTRELRLVDRAQRDRPEFDVRLSRAAATMLSPRGPSRARTWAAFHFDGRAYDVLRGAGVRVRFLLVPSGAGARLELVRGPPPNRFHPSFPLRTTFYYEWFPEGWTQEGGIHPFTWYHPSLGYYSSSNPGVVRRHIAAMLYGHIAVGAYDWWGRTSNQDARFPLVLALSRQTRLRWAAYYEAEGYGNPSSAQIHDDLAYLRARYFANPAYLRIHGRPVVFAFGHQDTCSVAQRWHDANAGIGAYLVLSAFAAHDHRSLDAYDISNPGGVRVATGDVDGDGKQELVTVPGPGAPPIVKVLRPDGSEVTSFAAGETTDMDGTAITAGALDGTRKAEIVTASDDTGVVRVYELVRGAALERALFASGLPGGQVAVGDVNGDGKAEIVVGAGPGSEPTVKVFDAQGRQLASFLAYEPGFTGGVSVAAGRVLGEKRAQIVTGTGRASVSRENEVRVFDERGGEVYPAFHPYPDFGGGLTVAVGDADEDGRPDVITGADANSDVRVFSLTARAARQVVDFRAFDPPSTGSLSLAAADTNGNGTADVVAGSPPGGGGQVRVLYGFRDCPDQPDAWHVYGAPQYQSPLPPYQFGISPGFDKIGAPEPGNTTKPRDLARWRRDIRAMVDSKAPWQDVFTFNEWGEGTAIESAQEWATGSGYGAYLDALHAAR